MLATESSANQALPLVGDLVVTRRIPHFFVRRMEIEDLKERILDLKREYLKAREASKRLELLNKIAELERGLWSLRKKKLHSVKPA